MFENFGKKLKSARINCGLSRKQVAELIGISSAIIGHYETGERMPSLTILVKLAAQYNVSIDYLLDNTATSNNNFLCLDGLSAKQIQVLKQTAECFRDLSTD